MDSELGHAALEYATKYNIPVLPLWPQEKTPKINGGFYNASTSPEQIKRWWTKWPDANIGGRMVGYVCIDFDVDENGAYNALEWLDDWETENGKLPETASAITGRGGTHLFYRVDREIKKSENKDIHIDVRGVDSYAMLAPSVHMNGNTVYWDLDPDDYGFADANELVYKLIDDVRPPKKETKKATVPSTKIKEGEGRNKFLYEQGCSARAKNADDEMIELWLTELNKAKCSPPLDDRELHKIIGSVCSKPVGLSDEAKELQKNKPGRPRKFDHVAVAKQLIDKNGFCLIDGMPAIRHGKIYEIGWKAVAREIIAINDSATRTNQKEVQHYLSVMAELKQQSDPALIAFKNGVLDVRTMVLRDFEETDVIPNLIPHDWDENAECADVDNVLLKMACGESDILESLMEVFGMCMYRSSEFTQSAILLGEGSNGKSTYIRMIQALLGKENISSLDMAMLGKQFHTGQLAGKLANLGDDISNEFQRGDLLAVFKKVVDGNRIYADVKGIEGFEFEPYTMLVFSANEFPRLADYTDGMLRRIFPIEFNAKFSKTDADYDPRISKKITTEKACQRMALLGVMGLQQVFENNGFTPNTASSRRVEEIKADNNTVLSWALESQWTTETLNGAEGLTLYKRYKQWCDECGFQAVSRTKFTRNMNKEYGMKSVDEWINGATKKVFRPL